MCGTWLTNKNARRCQSKPTQATSAVQLAHLCLGNCTLEYFRNLGLAQQCEPAYLICESLLRRCCGSMVNSRLNSNWGGVERHVNSIWRTALLAHQIISFILPNNLGTPSGEESERVFSFQDVSSGKWLRILNMTSDLLGLCLRGNRVLPE